MRVTVPIMRTLTQYTDVVVASAESLEDAADQVSAALDHKLKSARLLKGLTWSDLEVSDITVVNDGADAYEEKA